MKDVGFAANSFIANITNLTTEFLFLFVARVISFLYLVVLYRSNAFMRQQIF